MKKIKPKKKQEVNVKAVMTREKKMLFGGIAGAVLLLLVILVIAEGVSKSKISITNDTSRKITSVKAYFSGTKYEETSTDSDDKASETKEVAYQSENIADTELAAGETFKASLPDLSELKGTGSGLILEITFENEETRTIDTGLFNSKFDGKIKVVFKEDKSGEVDMKVKASTGLFGSTANTLCNDTYEMHLLDNE